MGYTTFKTHHPPAHIFLLGFFYSMGSDAMFALVIIQVLLFSISIAKIAVIMRDLNVRFGAITFFVFFCVAFCHFAAREVSVYKESLYLSCFVLFFCTYVEIAFLGKRKPPTWASLALLALSLALLRNDGIFVAGVSCLCLTLLRGRNTKLAALGVTAFLVSAALLINCLLWPSMGIVSGSKGEALSVPLQQTARYLVVHGDDVTAEEYEAISNVIDIEAVPEVYDSDFADPVKSLWTDPSDDEMRDYLKAWLSMFVRHPKVYFEAFALMSYGYFLPWPSNLNANPNDTFQLVMRETYEPYVALGFSFSDNTAWIRDLFESYCKICISSPLLCMLSNPGIYTWAIIACAIILACNYQKRRSANLVPLVPVFMVLLFCILGPVNGYMRYFLPIIPTLPIIIGITFRNPSSPARQPVRPNAQSQEGPRKVPGATPRTAQSDGVMR